METLPIKKLSTKVIVGNIRDILRTIEHDKGGVDLYMLGGIATGFSTGQGNYGEWYKIQGEFFCVDMINGKRYSAPVCFVNEPVQGYLLNALSNNNEVEFSVKVRLMRDDSSPVGYTYIMTPILNAEQADKLKNVRNRMLSLLAPPSGVEPESDEPEAGHPEEVESKKTRRVAK